MKKIYKSICFILLILLLFISGCGSSSTNSLKKALEETIEEFTSTYDLNNVTDDLEFIEVDKYGYYYLWDSSNKDVISNFGEVTRQPKNQEVTLTIKIFDVSNDEHLFYQQSVKCIVIKIDSNGYTYDLNNTKSFLCVDDLIEVIEGEEYVNYLEVIAYIYYFQELPNNYLTKSEAKALGWSGSGNVWTNDKLMNKCIGGDTFNNYEKLLPIVNENTYIEVDVNCRDGIRGKYRIVYNRYTFDIYYTDDHYNSFTYMIGVLK